MSVIDFPTKLTTVDALKIAIFDLSREIDRLNMVMSPYRQRMEELYIEIGERQKALLAAEAANNPSTTPEIVH